MAFFKKKKLSDGKWHAVAVNLQKPATIDDVADILAQRSTVSPGDVYAVLVQLGGVLGELMAAGRSVKLKGVGTFYLKCQTKKKGTDTPEELKADMITDVRVRFIPEYRRGLHNKITERTLIDKDLEWLRLQIRTNLFLDDMA